jgi:hypothetical protein
MHLLENAKEGLAYIMREVGAKYWGVEPTGSYIICSTGKHGNADDIFRVPAKNVALAEEAIDALPSKAVLDKVVRLDKLPKVIN